MGKGGDFEREQCKYLSLWITGGERDDVLWRNRLRKTIMSPDGRHQLGDIMATNAIGDPFISLFSVECKVGYSKTKSGKRAKVIPWDLLDIIDYSKMSQNPVLLQFWEQTKFDAELSRRVPMLIFRRDYHVPVVCMDKRDFRKIERVIGAYMGDRIEYTRVVREVQSPSAESMIVEEELVTTVLVLIREDVFFTWFRPESIGLVEGELRGV